MITMQIPATVVDILGELNMKMYMDIYCNGTSLGNTQQAGIQGDSV